MVQRHNIFRVCWSDYDSYSSWILTHETKTAQDFKADCEKAVREVGDEYIDNTDFWVGVPYWIEAAIATLKEYGYLHLRF